MTQSNYQALVEKWGPVLEHDSFANIKDQHRKSVTATVLENTQKALVSEGDLSANMTSLLSEATHVKRRRHRWLRRRLNCNRSNCRLRPNPNFIGTSCNAKLDRI